MTNISELSFALPVDPFAESKVYFKTQLQEFQFFDKYSRFNKEKGRRETWKETVRRAVDYLKKLSENRLLPDEYELIETSILNMDVMPSMRLLAMAGPAAERDPISIFNCAYKAIDELSAFTDILRLSMSGVGIGFSVEQRFVEKLPVVKPLLDPLCEVFVIEDSTTGWVNAFRFGLTRWYSGQDVRFDYSKIRPAGAELKIKGGVASGSGPLKELLDFTRKTIISSPYKRLTTVQVYDIVCMIGNCVVSGGVRRCLPAETRIHTKRGAIPIVEVKAGDLVMTDIGYKTVTEFVEQGKQDLVKITTESGTEFICTPDHRVAVVTDIFGGYKFKQAKDLTKTDQLMFIANEIGGESIALKSLPEFREADQIRTDIIQPSLTTETAWVLGKFFADGYVSKERGPKKKISSQFSFNLNEEEQIQRVSNWLKQHGVPHSIKKQEGNWVNIRISQRRFSRWLRLYKQANEPLVIPEEIWRSAPETRAAFVAGVFDGDGTASNRPIVIVSTVYENFARDIVKLLATLGIISEVRLASGSESRIGLGWKPLWRVTIRDGNALRTAKEKILKHSIKTFREIKNNGRAYSFPLEIAKKGMKQSNLPYYKYNTSNSSTIGNAIGMSHFTPVFVESVEPFGYDETYDISVEGNHVFVAEGYLVHNTAFLSLFDYNDELMLNAKSQEALALFPHRYYSNNSAVLPERKLSQAEVMQFVMQMHADGNGEPGMFSRLAIANTIPERRQSADFGVNACAESVLRNKGLCNLSSVICREEDTFLDLKEKVRVATMIGTIQSMATEFFGFDEEWSKNAKEERLLGVDLNAQMDCAEVRKPFVQHELKNVAIGANRFYSAVLGIEESKAITLVKPSGNSGVLLDVSSGIHPRWSAFYIRNVRVNRESPLYYAMQASGVPMNPENGQTASDATSFVVSFPTKSPAGAVTRHEFSALDQCNYWKQVKLNWCEHNPSVTIYYDDNEILDVARWIYENQSIISGMAFLPKSDATYEQAPYIEITEKEYKELAEAFPIIDFSLIAIEKKDQTTGSQQVACSAGSCDLHL